MAMHHSTSEATPARAHGTPDTLSESSERGVPLPLKRRIWGQSSVRLVRSSKMDLAGIPNLGISVHLCIA